MALWVCLLSVFIPSRKANAMVKESTDKWRLCLCFGILVWFVINLLQGVFTEINEDEAYYAIYGEHLAWGYYDHPPMVGLMAFLSSILFSGTLGVRFCTVIISTLTLFVIWKTIREKSPDTKKVSLFFILAFSIVMLNVYGFITTPDASLIFFSALFLLVYQSYLTEATWPKALLMGLLMALMMYSKYHAGLLLALIILSNLSLLKDSKLWVAVLIAIMLYFPHILWQFEADFPSFKYHLYQRSSSFEWGYLFEYIPNQLVVFNPFTFGAMVYLVLKHRPSDVFERGLFFIVIGFFFFFFLTAFRGHVEPHWTIVCAIPYIILLYRKCLIDDKLHHYVKKFVMPSILLIVVARIVLLLPVSGRFGFYGKEKYYRAIEEVAGENPVIFHSSFQKPSLYHYFTGKEASTIRNFDQRKTQFDLLKSDLQWTNKPVFVCAKVKGLSTDFQQDEISFTGYLTNHFQTANRLKADFSILNANDEIPVFHHGDTIFLAFTIENPNDATIDFQHSEFPMTLKAQYLDTDNSIICHYDAIPLIAPHSVYRGKAYTIVNETLDLGENRLTLSIYDRMISAMPADSFVSIRIE